jgi:hypothetical protein
MIDEPGGSGFKFAVYFVRGAGESRIGAVLVGEFVEGEQVYVFSLGDAGFAAAALRFGGCDYFADVLVDVLALLDIDT